MSALDSLPEFLCYDNKSCRYEDLIEDLQAQLRAAAAERDGLRAERDEATLKGRTIAKWLAETTKDRDELKRTIAQQAAQLEQARVKIDDAANVISLQAECIRQDATVPEHALLLSEIAKSYRAWLAANAPAPEACPACGTLTIEPTHDPTCPLFNAPAPEEERTA